MGDSATSIYDNWTCRRSSGQVQARLNMIVLDYSCRAKSTELLHSPPVYEADLDVGHDFYDYEIQDEDDFYYVSWEDPIYDVLPDSSGIPTKELCALYSEIALLLRLVICLEIRT